ncbi:MAG: ribonuclease P protein component [Bacilli bacterium]|nr:ribonuclease P protein component [Mollicutes bacterium]MDY3899297.1 ribonuclease P protein component [Bacilli bacterium]
MKKINRLKKNHDIALIVQKKQRIYRDNYIVYYQYTNCEIPKIAFSVSKKYGKAVERNKAKRRARSIFREYLTKIKNTNMVVVIKPASKEQPFEKLEKDLTYCIKTILLKQPKGEKNENN